MNKNCEYCNEVFFIPYKSWYGRRFCKYSCKAKNMRGRTPWNKGKVGEQIAWNKGIKGLQPWHNISGLRPHKTGEYTPSQQTIEKTRKAKTGVSSPLKGRKFPERSGANHPNWKGEDAGYFTKHNWVLNNYGKASRCTNRDTGILTIKCKNKTNNFDWANISGEYHRTIDDFMELCRSCHMLYDLGNKTTLRSAISKV